MRALRDLPVIGVAVFVFRAVPNDQFELLLLRRAFGSFEGLWCPVAGTVEAGEAPRDAALRELTEETALRASRLEAVDFDAHNEDAAEGRTGVIRIFAALVPSRSSTGVGDAEVVLDREHSDFRWYDLDAARRALPLEPQRRALQQIRDSFLRTVLSR